jgi:hypothetical protein
MVDNSDYVKIVRLPGGRLLVVARRIKAEASKRGLVAIATACAHAEALATKRIELEARYLGRGSSGRVEAGRLDTLIDGALHSIHHTCANAEAREAISPKKARAARKLRAAFFPVSVTAVTQVNYEEQLAQLERIIAHTKQADIKKAIETLALEDEVAVLVDKRAAYELAIQREVQDITYRDVQALRRESHEALCSVVILVLAATLDLKDEAQAAARAALLAPMEEQASIVTAQRRSKGPRTDIDPATDREQPIDPSLVDG